MKSNKKRTVFTNGCFDLVHVGHIRYLTEAKALGEYLVVGLNSDESIKRLKGKKRPILPEAERKELLEALSCVDQVIIFEEDTPLNLIKKIKPHILVKGGDWEEASIVGSEFVKQNGGSVLSLSFWDGRSTTSIIEKIQNLTV